MAGFEIILHPPSQFMKEAAVESSAWNKHCAFLALMGLAIHPSVQTVEVGHMVELASMDVSQEDRNLKADTPPIYYLCYRQAIRDEVGIVDSGSGRL